MKTGFKMREMNKEFIPYEEALAIKELGFDEPCLAGYKSDKKFYIHDGCQIKNSDEDIKNHVVTASLFQQAFRWFRKEYFLTICNVPLLTADFKHEFYIYNEVTGEKIKLGLMQYEEAELACLQKLIKVVQDSKS